MIAMQKAIDKHQRELSDQLLEKGKHTPFKCADVNISKYLSNLELTSPDCANAIAIKTVFLKECEKGFINKYKRKPESKEDFETMVKMDSTTESYKGIKRFMQANMHCFGDVLSGNNKLNASALEKMVKENPLADKPSNISLEDLEEGILLAAEAGLEEDKKYVKDFLKFKNVVNNYEKLNDRANGKPNPIDLEATKNEAKEYLKKLPTNYLLSNVIINNIIRNNWNIIVF